MTTCMFCHADVPDIGAHYARECPAVEGAFGKTVPKARGPAPMPPDVYGAEGRHRTCSTPGCLEPVWKAGRCFEHEKKMLSERKYGRRC